jgi:hypothetical protein
MPASLPQRPAESLDALVTVRHLPGDGAGKHGLDGGGDRQSVDEAVPISQHLEQIRINAAQRKNGAHTKAVDVGPGIGILRPLHGLRRGIAEGAERAGAGATGGVAGADQIEVGELRPPLGVEHNVGGLYIAVDHTAGVGEGQGLAHLQDQVQYAVRLRQLSENRIAQIATGQVLHDEVVMPFVHLLRVQDLNDALVLQRGHLAGAAEEAINAAAVLGILAVQYLDCDQSPVMFVEGAEDGPEPALLECLDEIVASVQQEVTGLQGV